MLYRAVNSVNIHGHGRGLALEALELGCAAVAPGSLLLHLLQLHLLSHVVGDLRRHVAHLLHNLGSVVCQFTRIFSALGCRIRQSHLRRGCARSRREVAAWRRPRLGRAWVCPRLQRDFMLVAQHFASAPHRLYFARSLSHLRLRRLLLPLLLCFACSCCGCCRSFEVQVFGVPRPEAERAAGDHANCCSLRRELKSIKSRMILFFCSAAAYRYRDPIFDLFLRIPSHLSFTFSAG